MNIRDCYDALGADYEEALKHLLNDDRIKKYAKKFSDGVWCAKLKDAYSREAFTELFELAHDIKGTTATLALTRLVELSTIVCDNLRACAPDEKTPELVSLLVEECIKTREMISICE